MLHSLIVNLPCVPEVEMTDAERLAFKYGHRQARHGAADLAAENAEYVARLESLVMKFAGNCECSICQMARATVRNDGN